LFLLENKSIANVIVVDDFLVIRYKHYHMALQVTCLGYLIFKTQALVDSCESIGFYQVLRIHNTVADLKADDVVTLELENIRINEGDQFHPPSLDY
jgi:hypothetical protein